MKKSLVVQALILLLCFLVVPLTSVYSTQDDPANMVGFSSYPSGIPSLQKISDTMNIHSLNFYRMSFNPEWYTSKPNPYNPSYVQYLLDSSYHTIIVDRNHLYPPTAESAQTAAKNWDIVRNSIFEVLSTWSNNQRVAVELINEYVSDDFYPRMQTLVDEIRAAGYTNPIVVNKWDQPWVKIKDPINNTYQGYHFYFNTWNVSDAIRQMKIAISTGIRIINTEVGADSSESRYFTVDTVLKLNDFLNQSATLGVGNCIWMDKDLDNWPSYVAKGLVFPGEMPGTVLHEVSFQSHEDQLKTSNIGTISCDGVINMLPNAVQKPSGTYLVEFSSDYMFSSWLTSGLVSVLDVNSQSTVMTITGKGVLTAMYHLPHPSRHAINVQVTGSGFTNASGTALCDADTYVSILATPCPDWKLSHWLLNGNIDGSNNPYTLKMNTSYGLTAVFTEVLPVRYLLQVRVYGSGSTNATGDNLHNTDDTVKVWAAADPDWGFSHWLLNGTNVGSINPFEITMNANYNLVSIFAQAHPLKFNLNTKVIGLGSTNATSDTFYDAGEKVAVFATANSGWRFCNWLLNDNDIGSANPNTVIMDADYDLTAVFAQIPFEYSITINFVGSGSVARDPDKASYVPGTSVRLNAIPASGYVFTGWSGDLTGSMNIATVTLNCDKIIFANFTQIWSTQYPLKDIAVDSDLASPEPNQTPNVSSPSNRLTEESDIERKSWQWLLVSILSLMIAVILVAYKKRFPKSKKP